MSMASPRVEDDEQPFFLLAPSWAASLAVLGIEQVMTTFPDLTCALRGHTLSERCQ
jgi:hypothetical protein